MDVYQELSRMLSTSLPKKHEVDTKLVIAVSDRDLLFRMPDAFCCLERRAYEGDRIYAMHGDEKIPLRGEEFVDSCGRFEAALKTTERDLVERCLLETLRDSVKSELRVRREVEFQTRRPRCLRAWGAIIAPHFPEIYSFDTVEALDQWVGATLPSLQDGKITRVDISDLSKLRRTGPFGDSLLFSPLEHYVTPIPAYRYQRTPSGHFRRQLRRYASGQDL